MDRSELLTSKEYWLSKIQLQLFALVEDYIEKEELNRTKFAAKLGVTKGYVSQVLNGDYDSRISKFVELSLAVGKIPFIEFKDIAFVLELDRNFPNGMIFSNEPITYGQLISCCGDDAEVEDILCSTVFDNRGSIAQSYKEVENADS